MYQVATVREGVQASVIEAEWNTISQWVVLDRTADRVRRWAVDTTHRTVTREIDLPLAPGDGVFALSARAAVVQNFLAAHEFPIVVTTTDDESTAVRWSDLQYCWALGEQRALAPLARGRRRADPANVGSAVRPADIPIACGLWFNATLNGDGTIGRQFVTIGEWEQGR